MSKRKKIVFHSDFSLTKSGFGRCSKALLSYLYKTGKYDIVHYCCHVVDALPDLQRTPWKSIGAMPYDQTEVNQATKHVEGIDKERLLRSMWYGAYRLDKVITEEKPDVYFGVQDIWGVDYAIDKPWFNKITSVIWTTLDSLPLLPQAVAKAPNVKNYWMWSSFATNDMHKLGHKHVKTFHGPLDDTFFYPLDKTSKAQVRKNNGIEEDRWIIGYVFRNQLRKSVPNLMEGYNLWKKSHSNIKSGLLLHTCFSEGWNIMELAKQNNIPSEEIYTTYVCRECKNYKIKPFCGEGQPCEKCSYANSSFTTNLSCGVSERHLNEVYNVMDVYCHPFTSGGQEIPIQEAKLAGLITLVTNYSCGEEMCEEGAYSLPLAWESYREFETQFIKATTLKESIAQQLDKVYNMSVEEKEKYSSGARKWALENYSIASLGKKMEEFLDSCPSIDWDNMPRQELKNPTANIEQGLNNSEYVKRLYKDILKMNVDDKDSGFQHWISQLNQGVDRQHIEGFFRETANKENAKIQSESNTKILTWTSQLSLEDDGKRILYVMPNGIGDVFLSTSLFQSIKEQYPDYNLYVATQKPNFEVLDGNPYVYKVIEYTPEFDNLLYLEGIGPHKGYFEIAFLPYVLTQRVLTYLHNGKTKIAYSDLKY